MARRRKKDNAAISAENHMKSNFNINLKKNYTLISKLRDWMAEYYENNAPFIEELTLKSQAPLNFNYICKLSSKCDANYQLLSYIAGHNPVEYDSVNNAYKSYNRVSDIYTYAPILQVDINAKQYTKYINTSKERDLFYKEIIDVSKGCINYLYIKIIDYLYEQLGITKENYDIELYKCYNHNVDQILYCADALYMPYIMFTFEGYNKEQFFMHTYNNNSNERKHYESTLNRYYRFIIKGKKLLQNKMYYRSIYFPSLNKVFVNNIYTKDQLSDISGAYNIYADSVMVKFTHKDDESTYLNINDGICVNNINDFDNDDVIVNDFIPEHFKLFDDLFIIPETIYIGNILNNLTAVVKNKETDKYCFMIQYHKSTYTCKVIKDCINFHDIIHLKKKLNYKHHEELIINTNLKEELDKINIERDMFDKEYKIKLRQRWGSAIYETEDQIKTYLIDNFFKEYFKNENYDHYNLSIYIAPYTQVEHSHMKIMPNAIHVSILMPPIDQIGTISYSEFLQKYLDYQKLYGLDVITINYIMHRYGYGTDPIEVYLNYKYIQSMAHQLNYDTSAIDNDYLPNNWDRYYNSNKNNRDDMLLNKPFINDTLAKYIGKSHILLKLARFLSHTNHFIYGILPQRLLTIYNGIYSEDAKLKYRKRMNYYDNKIKRVTSKYKYSANKFDNIAKISDYSNIEDIMMELNYYMNDSSVNMNAKRLHF